MRSQRRWIAVSLLGGLLSTFVVPSKCEAGPLLDWLFRRDKSQGLAAPLNAGTPGVTTAGYAPGTTCGTGFCQQTVVRYVPQIAYRTAYQPVPVTTYRTSTSINPANGLPITCTRPCTSYTYQARRVPYTTYRPVYTTVPVILPPSPNAWQDTSTSGFASDQTLYPPSYSYGYQPSTGTGCSNCQTGGGTAIPYAGPGYTPGDGGPLAPAPQSSWGTSQDAGPRATPWQAVPQGNGTFDPSSQDTVPADRAPSLRPNLGEYSRQLLRPVPMPESLRRSQDNDAYEQANQLDQNKLPAEDQPSVFLTPKGSANESNSINNSQEFGIGIRPEIQGPSNQNLNETRRPRFDSRAVRDLDREPQDWNYDPSWSTEDKTVRRNKRPAARSKSAPQPPPVTRYAAVPIHRSGDKNRRPADTDERTPTSPAWKWQRPSSSSDVRWVPIR